MIIQNTVCTGTTSLFVFVLFTNTGELTVFTVSKDVLFIFVRRVDLHMACVFQVCSIIVSHTEKSHVPSPVYQYTLRLRVVLFDNWGFVLLIMVKLLILSLTTGIGNPL